MSCMPTFPDDLNLADYFLFDRLTRGPGRAGRAALRRPHAGPTPRSRIARARSPGTWSRSGCAPEQRVYIVLPDTPPFAWSIFGTLAAGGVVAMGNPVAPTDDLAYVLDYIRARGADHHARRSPRRLAPALAALPHLRTILLCPTPRPATIRRPRSRCRPSVVRTGQQALSLDAAIARGPPARPRRCRSRAATIRRSGCSRRARPAEPRPRCTATATSRSTPRSTRSARSATARTTSRSACRGCSSATRPART